MKEALPILKKSLSKFGAFNRWLNLIGGGLILIISFLVTFQVIMRYFFHAAPSWTSDISRYLLLLVAFLPAAYALQQNAHISVDFLVSTFNKSIRKLFDVIYYVSIIVFSIIVGWTTFEYLKKAIIGGRMTQGNFMIPSSWLYGVMLFSLIMLIIVSLLRIFESISNQYHLPFTDDKSTEASKKE